MHKDDPVARISIEPDGIKWEENINKELLPIAALNAQDDDMHDRLTDWNDSRCIPFGRPNYKELSRQAGVNRASDWILKSHMCSLTDCYWFKTVDSDISWNNVNFHENGSSSNVYKFLFYGNLSEVIQNFNSPDLTTDGYEPKCWLQRDGDFYLAKSSHAQTTRIQCNEKIASWIFSEMGINCVPYELEYCNNKLCSVSKCFINSDKEEFVPTEDLLVAYGHDMFTVREMFEKLGLKSSFDKMVLADYIIGNVDRHAHNFGVIVDSETHEILRFAPLFDHGESYMRTCIDSHMYLPGAKSFGNAILDVDKEILPAVNKIDPESFIDLLHSIPYLEEDVKEEIYYELFRRVDFINELSIEREVEIDDREH